MVFSRARTLLASLAICGLVTSIPVDSSEPRAPTSLPASVFESRSSSASCRCMPGDECWPSIEEWTQFNASVGGRLIPTSPLGSPCHDPFYNATECEYLQKNWLQPETHDDSPSSIMAPAVANLSCDAFTPRSQPCLLGNMVYYSVNVSSPEDIAKTISFAKDKNLRLTIRNTGHDYLGKSTGAGALSIWTHYLKQVEFYDHYETADGLYSGSAAKLGAGILGHEAYSAAHEQGKVIVGGECGTVGPVGGYTQGGGHSALSSMYGMAADQVLEWEVVDGTGRYMKASRSENSDMYWALTGGGGGTYGVAMSMTVKTRPDFPVTGVVLNFTSDNVPVDTYFDAIGYFNELLPSWSAKGAMTIAEISNTSFVLTPVTLPKFSADEARALVQPFTDYLTKAGIKYDAKFPTFSSYLYHWETLINPNPTQLVQNAQSGGWLIPRDVVRTNNKNLTAAIRSITNDGVGFVEIGLDVSTRVVGNDTFNSVLPAWRDAAFDVIMATPWPKAPNLAHMKVLSERMTQDWVPALANLASKSSEASGAYLSEADPSQGGWKKAFYGSNYDSLLSIKHKYDPDGVFYAVTAVGSDAWETQEDGRLCRSS